MIRWCQPGDRVFKRPPGGAGAPAAPALVVTCTEDCLRAAALEEQLETAGLVLVRTEANIVPPFGTGGAVEDVIEQAVRANEARHLIVLGHTNCRLLAQLFDPTLALRELRLAAWLEHAEAVRRATSELPAEGRLARAIELNVAQQAAHLRSHPAVAAALLADRARLHAWLLDAERAGVFAADPATGRFTRHAAVGPGLAPLFRFAKPRGPVASPFPPRDWASRYLA